MKNRVVRKCLKCNKPFYSQSIGNRLCHKCHTKNEQEYDPTTTIVYPTHEKPEEETR